VPLPKNILIIDDDLDMHKLIKVFLKRDGYTFHSAFNPEEGLEKYREFAGKLTLTFLDIHLPHMKGTVLLDGLKKLDAYAPVIIITANPTMENTLEALNRGASDFLAKPLSKQTLLESVSRTLRVAFLKQGEVNKALDITHTINVKLPCMRDIHWGVTHYLFSVIKGMGYMNDFISRAILEAIRNAIEHGNCFDPEKMVTVEAVVRSDRLAITVTDEGDGFDVESFAQQKDLDGDSRGLLLINAFMDKVSFNQQGNSITMIKYPFKT